MMSVIGTGVMDSGSSGLVLGMEEVTGWISGAEMEGET